MAGWQPLPWCAECGGIIVREQAGTQALSQAGKRSGMCLRVKTFGPGECVRNLFFFKLEEELLYKVVWVSLHTSV